MEILLPSGWPRPSGYSNGIIAEGRSLFVAGQIGWDETGRIVSDQLTDQVRQALTNIVTVLRTGGSNCNQVVRMTWYVTDLDEYRSNLKEIGDIYRNIMGKNYPAMTLVQVKGLLEPGAKVEIEATAMLGGGTKA